MCTFINLVWSFINHYAYKCRKFGKVSEIVSVRVTTKVSVSILAMLQFSDDYHVRVISTGDEMARKSLSPNSTYAKCCGFAIQQIRRKSTTNPQHPRQIYSKSTTNRISGDWALWPQPSSLSTFFMYTENDLFRVSHWASLVDKILIFVTWPFLVSTFASASNFIEIDWSAAKM